MTSKLMEMQSRFQQKQIQEREEKLLRLYENQQQKAFERMGRGSAGSNNSLSTTGGKVRQMFDERRQKAGIDRSYPLEPLKNGSAEKKTVKKVVKKTQVRSTKYNNNGFERYEEYNYSENGNGAQNLIDLLNNHNLEPNLEDSIDNEKMPELDFDAVDDMSFTGKLSNVGGQLPSESIAKARKSPISTLGKTFRKDTKPIVRRSVKPAPTPSLSTTTVQSQPLKTVTTPTSSPARSVSHTMQTPSKSGSVKKGPSQTMRAPSNSRPSSNQKAKSPVVRDDLNECKFCSRRFTADRLALHETICGKTSKKKRKTYDAVKHRVEGTELAPFVKKGARQAPARLSKPASKKDWRRTHEEFINTIRAAKSAQAHVAKGGKLSDLPPPPPSTNPDYVQCPHCGRKFNESAAERHIPKCANYLYNKPKAGAKVSGKGR